MSKQRALIVEFHRYHDEVLPSWARAFQDAGVNVDVLTRKENWVKDAFVQTRRPNRSLTFYPWQRLLLKKGFPNVFFQGYDVVVFNSVEPSILLETARRFHPRVWGVLHNAHLSQTRPDYAAAAAAGISFWGLAEFISEGCFGAPRRTLFPYYLSDSPRQPEAGPIRFCVQGNFEYGRRNYPSLLEVLKRFKAEGRSNFEVVFVGNVSPPDMERFQQAGREYGVLDKLRFLNGGLKYGDYYSHIASCHFLLPLVEPGIPALEAYYKDSASSSISMALGLGVTPVIDRKLAALYGLPNAAVTYNPAETLYQAMSAALELSEADRTSRAGELRAFRERRLAQNAANVKALLG